MESLSLSLSLSLAEHYKLKAAQNMKNQVKLLKCLIDEEIVPEDEPTSTTDVIALRKLQLQTRKKSKRYS